MSGLGKTFQWKGSDILELDFEEAMLLYHLFMGGINRSDQLQEIGAGFALKAHPQKWYKKITWEFWISCV